MNDIDSPKFVGGGGAGLRASKFGEKLSPLTPSSRVPGCVQRLVGSRQSPVNSAATQ